ncbi:MAG: 23S rRNA (uracil(1939)-C(5))-methyltransferase RlmD [Oscillospiraceae bacterium]|nr:23S rRNA (uracil(1939)-C(5))-methyltransferase RlmD [Oscillospiraceae bacterium]
MLKKNDIIPLEITTLSNDGNGIGRYNDMVVFLPYSCPGDKLNVKITKVKSDYAYGIINKIVVASTDRIESDCRSFGRCGGCSFRHISYPAELSFKRQYVNETLKRIGKIDCLISSVTASSENHYRNKLQLPVFSHEGRLETGFYAKRSHRIIHFSDYCLLDSPRMHEIAVYCCSLLTNYRLSSYDETTGKGLVRHIIIRQSHSTTRIMLILVLNGDGFAQQSEFVERITEEFLDIETIVINSNTSNTNVILGDNMKTIYGNGYLFDSILDITLRLSPSSFLQINHDICEQLYQKVAEYVSPHKEMVLLDLFCGIGSIGLTLAKQIKKVIGIEANDKAVSDASFNARYNEITNATYIAADVKMISSIEAISAQPIDVVVVDPPRKGCGQQTIEAIIDISPRKIVYVSCNPATLGTDCLRLNQMGYELRDISLFDMFPRTPHTETVVLLERTNN